VEGVRVLIEGSFLIAPISLKGAEAMTGEAVLIEEVDKIAEKRLVSSRTDSRPGRKKLLYAISGPRSWEESILTWRP